MPVKLDPTNRPSFHEAETPSPMGSEPSSAGSTGRPVSPATPDLPSHYEPAGTENLPNKLFLKPERKLSALLAPPQGRVIEDPFAYQPTETASPPPVVDASIEAMIDAAPPGASLAQILGAPDSPRPVQSAAAGADHWEAAPRPGADLSERLRVRPFPYTLSRTVEMREFEKSLAYRPFPYTLGPAPSAGAALRVTPQPALEAKHLSSLQLMRFTDDRLNRSLLWQFNYDLNRVVDVLIAMEELRAESGG